MSGSSSLSDALVSPYGIVSGLTGGVGALGPERLHGRWARVGSGSAGVGRPRSHHVITGGLVWDEPDTAELVAVAEAAERYAATDVFPERHVRASADDLAGDCLEPTRFPRCSAREYADPRCPLLPFDPAAPVRWVAGTDLATGQDTYVPAVMASYRLDPESPAERFTYRVSTGFAVHTDPVEAVVRAVCEIVERDAVAVLWLQRLRLPLVGRECLPEAVAETAAWCERHFLSVTLFDATTDLGVPTAYCVLRAPHDRQIHQVVGAGTGRTLGRAAQKALFEALGVRGLLQSKPAPVAEPAAFASIEDGSRYLAAADRAPAFDFLFHGAGDRPAGPAAALPADPAPALAALAERLTAAGARAVAVDRTPCELADAGLTAVSVVIPDLQPMSLLPYATFKGHPRLYEAPLRMGHQAFTEEELNPWPQPFA